mmetsp:Transcript_70919/g.207812  ORF Transcript_70919/g.207812 Transcript_70919/m.207812 type:complete len:381 (-) Transcript_70919:203-1345(-)
MSGLELLFLDGGTTVAGLATAALGALGYKQRQRDSRELADVEELGELLTAVQKAHDRVVAGHGASTDAWRGPLSLFGAPDAARAAAGGVPAWAVGCVQKGRALVDRAAQLEDLADVYVVQLGIAIQEGRGGKGLLRAPPRLLVQRLCDLDRSLHVHVPYLQVARAAFDAPADQGPQGETPEEATSSFHLCTDEDDAHLLPIAILRNRGRLGELWRLQGQKMGNLFAARSGSDAAADAVLPPEVQSKLTDIRSTDQHEATAAAWALGRLGAEAAQADGDGPELAAAVQRACTAALRAVLLGNRRSPRERVRKAALESLARIASPDAAAALREVQLGTEETTACHELASRLLAGLADAAPAPEAVDAPAGLAEAQVQSSTTA